MPKLSKIRISGNRYDAFQKRHMDSIFNLGSDDEGEHTLFTLQNGSGKGVMLQLISQIMLPGTAWGRNNGSKVIHMFYNRYQVFKPYTFHVALEWNLEHEREQRLVSGICISAYTLDQNEGKVGLKYFLYTHEYSGTSKFSLDNLPLYLKSEERALSYAELESLLEDNKHALVKYSKSSVSNLNSEYYQYLASHGIYRSEWEIMKSINRAEGGLEKYFSQAKDNQALFDKLIIPALSESISSHSEENRNSLLNMFVDNIKIAENLPKLLSRSEDITQLLRMVEPLIGANKSGIKLNEIMRLIKERGNNYLSALQSRNTYLKNELERSQKDKQKTEEKIEELKFEQRNLKYATKVRELNIKQEEHLEFKEIIVELEEQLAQLTAEQKKLELNKYYLTHQELKKEYRQLKQRLAELKSATSLTDLKEKIETQSREIEKQWPQLKEKWEQSSGDYDAYLNYLDFEERRLKEEQEKLESKLLEKILIVKRYQEKQEEVEIKREELATRFNALELLTPAYLVEDLAEHLDKIEQSIKDLIKQRAEVEEELKTQHQAREELKIEVATLQSRAQSLEESYQKIKSREEELTGQLVKLLSLDKFKEVYSPEWLRSNKIKLQKLLAAKENKLQSLIEKRYELELDLILNQDDYWIANHNQKRLYEQICQLDIKVYYGSDFLINFCEEQEELLQKHPLIPYGLVLMYDGEWQKVQRNLEETEIFRAPVPIFINYQLEEQEGQNAFKLVQGQEEDFITIPSKYEDWYQQLDTRKGEINRTIETLKGKLERIKQMIYASQELLEGQSSSQIAEKSSAITEEVAGLKGKIKNYQQKIRDLQIKEGELGKQQLKKEKRKENLKEDYSQLQEFTKKVKELKEEEAKIASLEQKIAGLKEKSNQNKAQLEQNKELQFKTKNDYQGWLDDLEYFLGELKDLIPDIEFNEQEEIAKHSNYPQLYDYRDSALYADYQQLLDLEKEEEEKNLEIKFLRKERSKLKKRILEVEGEMTELAVNWRSYSFEFMNLAELKVNLKALVKRLAQQEQKREQLKEKSDILSGEIKNKKQEISELSAEIKERFQKSARAWPKLELKSKEQEINSALQENRSYLGKLEEMIEGYQDKINSLANLINQLNLYQLDAQKGELRKKVKEEVETNAEELVANWVKEHQKIKNKLDDLKEEMEAALYKFKADVNKLEDDILKSNIQEKIIADFRIGSYDYNQEILSTFQNYLHQELNKLDDDKSAAEEARNQWAQRAAMQIMRIINSLQEMINNMVYHNQKGYAFPLVRLHRTDLLPEGEEEIVIELKEYFVELIERFQREELDVESLSKSQLKKYSGNAALFARALRGRYPTLQVYKMTEKNEFLYARPQDYYYADWEAVIQGKGDSSEGSGGQSLSINAFMMMMLLNYKKQRLDQDQPWTVLLLDNPFGKASAAHVLDPIFKIANKLNFQIIAFAAPEIIKTEISARFPVFWALEISQEEEERGALKGQVIYGDRVRRD